MAPWWLRANDDEARDGDEVDHGGEIFEIDGVGFEDFPEDALELIASESDDEDDGKPEADGKPENERSRAAGDDAEPRAEGGEVAEPPPRRKRKRRRKRKTKSAASEIAAATPETGAELPTEEDPIRAREAGEEPPPSAGRAERTEPVERAEPVAERTAATAEKPAEKPLVDKKPPVEKEKPPVEKEKPPVEKEKPPVEKRVEPLSREEVLFDFDLPERSSVVSEERKIALFCDLENIALGVRDSDIERFEINLVLERVLEKGKIVVKRAYADWERYSEYKRAFHEAAIELIDIPHKRLSGKNSADIKMVVDAMDLCFSKEHLDTFVLLSGDSDFSPLVSKLKENNKYVIGVGVRNSTSDHLIDNCDEFIYYEDVWRDIQRTPPLDHLSEKEAEVFGLLVESILALLRDNKSVVWGSMLKQTMQRKRPSFNEGYYGYSSFSELLDDAEQQDIIRLKRDKRSGNYAVIGFGQQKG